MTKDVFEPVLGAGNDCDPKDIFIGATCDQGCNFINALESMGIPVNAIVTAQIQGGRHGFIGKAINDFTCLFSSMVDDTQEIRDLDDPHNGPRTEVSKNTLNTEVQRALEVTTQDMGQRNLGKAILDIEAINLVLDHRFKSCCTGVCLNGSPALRAQVGTAMQGLCYQFVSNVGAVDKGDGGAAGAGEPGGEGTRGNEAAGGGGAEGGDAAPVPEISRMEKIRRQRSLLVVQPDAGAGAEEDLSRSTAAEREFEDYRKMPPAANSHDFDLLNAWKSYGPTALMPRQERLSLLLACRTSGCWPDCTWASTLPAARPEGTSPLSLLSSATYKVTWEGARLR